MVVFVSYALCMYVRIYVCLILTGRPGLGNAKERQGALGSAWETPFLSKNSAGSGNLAIRGHSAFGSSTQRSRTFACAIEVDLPSLGMTTGGASGCTDGCVGHARRGM